MVCLHKERQTAPSMPCLQRRTLALQKEHRLYALGRHCIISHMREILCSALKGSKIMTSGCLTHNTELAFCRLSSEGGAHAEHCCCRYRGGDSPMTNLRMRQVAVKICSWSTSDTKPKQAVLAHTCTKKENINLSINSMLVMSTYQPTLSSR